MVADVGKLVALVVGLLLGGAIIILGVVLKDQGAQLTGVGIVGPIVGYLTGNGVLARRGQAPSAVLVAKPDKIAGTEAADPADRDATVDPPASVPSSPYDTRGMP